MVKRSLDSLRNKFFLLIIAFALFFPQNVFAFVTISPWDYVATALGGIEEKSRPLLGAVVLVFLLYSVGLILLYTSAALLDWVISQSSAWLTIHSPLVIGGFSFVAGLANMFLILIFIFIAFAFILKLEFVQPKRALVKLIIIALLMNFSLVFIGMFIDLANIFYNTILRGNENLANQVIRTLVGGMEGVVSGLVGMFLVFAASVLIPMVHSLPLQVGALLLVTVVFLPNLVTWTFQIILAFLMAGIFFLYIFFFAVRVFIIQILAILSPLAFLCMILRQTEKYWQEWLEHLTQWMLFGITLLFFLVIGLKSSAFLIPPGGPTPLPGVGWYTGIDTYFFYYLFLFIYMVLALWVSKRTMPALAEFIFQQVQTWAMRAWTGVGTPLTRGAQRQLREMAAKELARKERLEEKQRRKEKLTGREQLALLSGKISMPFIKAYHRAAKTTIPVEITKEIEGQIKNMEEKFGGDVKSAVEVYGNTRNELTRASLALYLAKRKGAKGLNLLDKDQFSKTIGSIGALVPHKMIDIVKHMPEIGDPTRVDISKQEKDLAQYIREIIIPKGFEDKDVEKLIEVGIDKNEAIKLSVYKKAVDELKHTDIENLTEEVINSKEFLKMVALFKPWSFIRTFGEERGRDYLEKLQDVVEKEIGIENLSKFNPTFARAPYSPLGSIFLRRWKKGKKPSDPYQTTLEQWMS